jgi:hypothetical protein
MTRDPGKGTRQSILGFDEEALNLSGFNTLILFVVPLQALNKKTLLQSLNKGRSGVNERRTNAFSELALLSKVLNHIS